MGYIELVDTGSRFFNLVLKHVRIHICKSKKISLTGAGANALCAAIAASLAPDMGLPAPAVIGIVAAVLHFVLTVLKGAFCEMTDEKVVDAIKETKPASPRARATTKKKQ